MPDQKPAIRKKISSFAEVIKALRLHAEEGMGPSDLLKKLVELTQYEEHLRKTQQDWESRWQNVQELINFASETERDLPALAADSVLVDAGRASDWGDVVEDEYEEEELDDLGFAEIKRKPREQEVVQTERYVCVLRIA